MLGADDPRLETLRLVRDRVLGGSAIGRRLIGWYYAGEIEFLLAEDPVWRTAGRSLLETALPLIEQLVTALPEQCAHRR